MLRWISRMNESSARSKTDRCAVGTLAIYRLSSLAIVAVQVRLIGPDAGSLSGFLDASLGKNSPAIASRHVL